LINTSILINKRAKLEHRFTRSTINIILRNKNITNIKV